MHALQRGQSGCKTKQHILSWCCALQAAGVHVESFHYDGTFHGFLGFPVPQAAQALEVSASQLRSAFSA